MDRSVRFGLIVSDLCKNARILVPEATCLARLWLVDPLIKEKNLHREQFINCRKKLNASNDLVKELENELMKELKCSIDDRNDLNNTINL